MRKYNVNLKNNENFNKMIFIDRNSCESWIMFTSFMTEFPII